MGRGKTGPTGETEPQDGMSTMNSLTQKTYRIDDFISLVQSKNDRSGKYDKTFRYDVYGGDTSEPRAGRSIFVGDTVQVDDEDNEITLKK